MFYLFLFYLYVYSFYILIETPYSSQSHFSKSLPLLLCPLLLREGEAPVGYHPTLVHQVKSRTESILLKMKTRYCYMGSVDNYSDPGELHKPRKT